MRGVTRWSDEGVTRGVTRENMRSYSLVTSRHVTPKPRLFNTKYNIMFGPVHFGPKVIKLNTIRK